MALLSCSAGCTHFARNNWSERSAWAALGCWHKRRWPLFYFSTFLFSCYRSSSGVTYTCTISIDLSGHFSATTFDHLRLLTTTYDHLRQLMTTHNNLWPLQTTHDNSRPLRTTYNHLRLLTTTYNHLRQLTITDNQLQPFCPQKNVDPWKFSCHYVCLDFWKFSGHYVYLARTVLKPSNPGWELIIQFISFTFDHPVYHLLLITLYIIYFWSPCTWPERKAMATRERKIKILKIVA